MITKKDSKKRFTMLVTDEQKRELRVLAALNNLTMTQLVDRAIRNEVARLKEKK